MLTMSPSMVAAELVVMMRKATKVVNFMMACVRLPTLKDCVDGSEAFGLFFVQKFPHPLTL